MANAAEHKYTNESMKVDTVLGVGSGTLAVIIAIALGVVVCVFGLAFPFPGLFVFIGILIPALVLLFVALCPRIEEKKILDWQNSKRNNYVVARWFHFLIMLLLFLGLAAPTMMYLSTTVIPQKVDSRAQLEYDEKYLKFMEEQRKRKYNLIEIEPKEEKLPLNNNRKNNNQNEKSLISNDDNQLPPSSLPKSSLHHDLTSNRNKYNRFKRVKKKPDSNTEINNEPE